MSGDFVSLYAKYQPAHLLSFRGIMLRQCTPTQRDYLLSATSLTTIKVSNAGARVASVLLGLT
jgi:hypothetical protein